VQEEFFSDLRGFSPFAKDRLTFESLIRDQKCTESEAFKIMGLKGPILTEEQQYDNFMGFLQSQGIRTFTQMVEKYCSQASFSSLLFVRHFLDKK
jgi:hypothetical protein